MLAEGLAEPELKAHGEQLTHVWSEGTVRAVAMAWGALQSRCWAQQARYWKPEGQGESELKEERALNPVMMACPKRDWTSTDAWKDGQREHTARQEKNPEKNRVPGAENGKGRCTLRE